MLVQRCRQSATVEPLVEPWLQLAEFVADKGAAMMQGVVSPIEPDSSITRPSPKTVQKGAKDDAIDSVLPEPEAPRRVPSGSPPPVGARSSTSSEVRSSGDIGRGELKGGQVDGEHWHTHARTHTNHAPCLVL